MSLLKPLEAESLPEQSLRWQREVGGTGGSLGGSSCSWFDVSFVS